MDSSTESACRIAAAVLNICISVAAMFLNVLNLVVFIQNHKYYRNYPIYVIAGPLTICQIINCTIQLYIAVPITIANREVFAEPDVFTTVARVLYWCEFIAYKGTLVFVILMSLNRAAIFFVPRAERVLFHGRGLRTMLLASSCYILVESVLLQTFGCAKRFSSDAFYFYWDCADGTFSATVLQINMAESYAHPAFVLFINMCTVFFLFTKRNRRSSIRKNKSELRMLMQMRADMFATLQCRQIDEKQSVFNVSVVAYSREWKKRTSA
ncbi:unnamed protein product, partial [Mesorhabditis spiculigera]